MITINKEYKKPSLDLKVCRVEASCWYNLGFFKHHYMSASLNKSCKCLLFTHNDMPVAFVAIINNPGKGRKYDHRISRIVIDPNFQGLGLTRKILDFCGGIIKAKWEDANLHIKTIHTNAGKMLERNNNWSPTAYNGKIRNNIDYEGTKYKNRLKRASYCYKYSGQPIYGYEDLLLPINVLRERKSLSL